MTRAELESERDILAGIRDDINPVTGSHRIAALTASIARVEALLSIDDAEADKFVEAADAEIVAFDGQPEYAAQLRTLRAIVRIIRRTA